MMRQRKIEYSIKIIFWVVFICIFFYNFLVAKENLFKAGGDSASFIELGVALEKNQRYGSLDTPTRELIEDFKTGSVANKKYNFLSHSTWRPPVWPFLIAGIFWIFGYSLLNLLIFKFLVHLIGIFLFYRILKELRLRKIFLFIGVFLYGTHPTWQLYSRVFLSEPITLFIITLWVFYLVRFLKDKNSFWLQAILGGLIILSHPYYIFLPFSVWLFLYFKRKIRLKKFLVFSTICISVVSIWIIRNYIVLETDSMVLTTSSGAVMAKGWNESVPREHSNTRGDLADEGLVLQDYDQVKDKNLNEVQRMQLYKNATINFIKNNPEMVLPIIGKKLLSALNPFPETPKSGILETGRTFFHLLALIALLYVIFFTKDEFLRALGFGLLLATIGITVFAYSGFRFRMPQVVIELLLIICSVNHITIRLSKVSSRTQGVKNYCENT